jgi:hypothetical protein
MCLERLRQVFWLSRPSPAFPSSFGGSGHSSGKGAYSAKLGIGITAAGPLLRFTGFPIKLLHLNALCIDTTFYTTRRPLSRQAYLTL